MNPLRKSSFSTRWLLPVVLLLVAVQQLGSGAVIFAKAKLAQRLIGAAWEDTLHSGGVPHKPWPWADTWPVARLEVPRHGVDLFVLRGAAGNSLAFGPGHETASAVLGTMGTAVVGGHRDTHFRFLEALELNTLISVQLPSGERSTYQVSSIRIVDTGTEPTISTTGNGNQLLLVTCYPFDAVVPGGPLRYVVGARRVMAPALAMAGAPGPG